MKATMAREQEIAISMMMVLMNLWAKRGKAIRKFREAIEISRLDY